MSGDATPRGPGRPRIPSSERVVTVTSTVKPATRQAWKASGRTLDDVMRAGLGLD